MEQICLEENYFIEEAISTRKKDPKQNKRPIFFVNNFPENQDLFKQPRIISGNKLYATAVSEQRNIWRKELFKTTTKKENFYNWW